MRSPADVRTLFEHALRSVALAAMVALAVRLWSGSDRTDTVSSVTSASLDSALIAWSVAAPARVHVNATTTPDGRQRDWLVALRRAGLPVTWSARDSSGGALVVETGPLAEFPLRVTALTTPGNRILLSDHLGRIDSSQVGREGVAEWRANPIGEARVTLGASTASAAPRDSMMTRPVLVVGQAGWESKFVVAALEEHGWSVVARLTVAPGAVVRQGPGMRIDTASLSAIVVLDSTSVLDAGELARFVNDGGGLVASGAGSNHPALRTLAARVSASSAGEIGGLLGPAPRTGLSSRTFAVSMGSVALERRGDAPVVVARRVGAGRVIVTGYDDTWRVRMTPTSDVAPESHRTWWSSLVAGVAHSRPMPREVPAIDEAPFAATVAALGFPASEGQGNDPARSWPLNALLAALAAAALLGEWLSRRLRGVS